MKKFLALVLAVLMIASTVVSVAAFDDVAADNKYANAIEELQGYGVVAGKTETEFAPDELVTRWQMALFMARANSGETDDAAWNIGASLFTDCTQYLGAIQYCYTKGIIKGVTDTEFAPNANITLRDGVIMAVRALGYEKEDAEKYEVKGASYWLPYWQKADEIGMLDNLTDLPVTAELTRAQTAQLIYNMLNSVVYNYDVNGYKYTLEEVVFGGKQIVNVDNVTGAWIVETPLQGILGELDEDEEYVIVMVNDEDGDHYVDVPFADLEAAGVDVENIEEYFGAYIELINCRIDYSDREDDGKYNGYEHYIYQEYEYLAGVNTENKFVTTDADVVYHKDGDRIRIGTKTHYLADSDSTRNIITVYTLDVENGEWVEIETSVNAALKGKFYDVTFVDADVDGYYEAAFVNFYNIDTYKAPKANGKETCGVMKDEKDVEYSEELSAGEVFVYTYNPFMKTVDVKGTVEVAEGKITAYSNEEETDANDTKYYVATIEIDGEEYEVTYYNTEKSLEAFAEVGKVLVGEDDEYDLDAATKADVASFAENNISGTYEFYLFNGMLLAWGKEVEDAAASYLVVEEFTDFELYDHVVLSALIDGKEETIEVKKIYEKVDGVKKVWADIEDLGYGKLSKKLDDIFGMYSYTVDENGYYVLTKFQPAFNLNQFVTTAPSGSATTGYINFKDWETTGVVNVEGTSTTDRTKIIRVNSATNIYVVNMEDQEVTVVKPSSAFSIELTKKTEAPSVTFYADRVGYGDTEEDNTNVATKGIKYGKASVLYIVTDGEYVEEEDYKLVYVQEEVTGNRSGSAATFELETGDEEETYFKYSTDDGEAYLATATFETVDEIYVSKTFRNANSFTKLVPGLYILNNDNIIVDYEEKANLTTGNFTYGNATIAYEVWTVAASDIDLFSQNYKQIAGHDGDLGKQIQTIKFRFITEEYSDDTTPVLVDVYANDYTNKNIINYMEDESIVSVDVLVIPNKTAGFDPEASFISNTLAGIVIG